MAKRVTVAVLDARLNHLADVVGQLRDILLGQTRRLTQLEDHEVVGANDIERMVREGKESLREANKLVDRARGMMTRCSYHEGRVRALREELKMPWDAKSFKKHNKKLSGKSARGAAKVATKVLAKTGNEGLAIREGNAVGDRIKAKGRKR